MSSNETITVSADADGGAQIKEAAQQLRHDLILSFILILVTVVYAIEIISLPRDSPNQADVGPRMYPNLILVFLGTCVVTLATTTAMRWFRRSRHERMPDSAQTRMLLRVFVIVVISIVYVVVMGPLGFVISTAIYLAALSVIIGGNRSLRSSAIALGFGCVGSLAIYLLFGSALGLLLPSGPLPF